MKPDGITSARLEQARNIDIEKAKEIALQALVDMFAKSAQNETASASPEQAQPSRSSDRDEKDVERDKAMEIALQELGVRLAQKNQDEIAATRQEQVQPSNSVDREKTDMQLAFQVMAARLAQIGRLRIGQRDQTEAAGTQLSDSSPSDSPQAIEKKMPEKYEKQDEKKETRRKNEPSMFVYPQILEKMAEMDRRAREKYSITGKLDPESKARIDELNRQYAEKKKLLMQESKDKLMNETRRDKTSAEEPSQTQPLSIRFSVESDRLERFIQHMNHKKAEQQKHRSRQNRSGRQFASRAGTKEFLKKNENEKKQKQESTASSLSGRKLNEGND